MDRLWTAGLVHLGAQHWQRTRTVLELWKFRMQWVPVQRRRGWTWTRKVTATTFMILLRNRSDLYFCYVRVLVSFLILHAMLHTPVHWFWLIVVLLASSKVISAEKGTKKWIYRGNIETLPLQIDIILGSISQRNVQRSRLHTTRGNSGTEVNGFIVLSIELNLDRVPLVLLL